MGSSTVSGRSVSPTCEEGCAPIEQLEAHLIRAVIFDLDGVIADSHALHEHAWQELLVETGQVPAAALAEIVRQGKTRIEILKALFPGCSSEELHSLGARKDAIYQENSGRLRPIAGVGEWIRELHRGGFSLAVATSASRQRTYDTLRQFGVEDLFDVIVTASDVAAGKPDPALFLAAAKALGVEPSQTLVIEDSEAGLVGAKAAGMKCALYSPGFYELRAISVQPDLVLRAFAPEYLRSLPGSNGSETV